MLRKLCVCARACAPFITFLLETAAVFLWPGREQGLESREESSSHQNAYSFFFFTLTSISQSTWYFIIAVNGRMTAPGLRENTGPEQRQQLRSSDSPLGSS